MQSIVSDFSVKLQSNEDMVINFLVINLQSNDSE